MVPVIILQYVIVRILRVVLRYKFDKPWVRALAVYLQKFDLDLVDSMAKLLLEGHFDLTFCTVLNLYWMVYQSSEQ